jgi:hypothetical protein
MFNFLLFVLLLTLIFSWEETVSILSRMLSKGREGRSRDFSKDRFVGIALIMITLPIALMYSLKGTESFSKQLGMIALEMFLIFTIAIGSGKLMGRLRQYDKYEGIARLGVLGFTAHGTFSPAIDMVMGRPRDERVLLGRYAFYLSLAIIAGFFLSLYLPTTSTFSIDLSTRLNTLNVVLLGSVMVLIVSEFLKRHFNRHSFNFLSYFRILVGIGIILIMFPILIQPHF